jgi:cell division septal protein FtsQ
MSRARQARAEQRALKAAAEPKPWLPPRFVLWALGRLLALGVLLGAGWIVYDSASSDRFQVRSIHVQGNVLLSQADVERVAAVKGTNVFWIDRALLAERVRRLPLVALAEITPTLPDGVDVAIVERQPAAFWQSGDKTYLVDREGVILKSVDAEAQQARACAGQPCDPRLASLPAVTHPDGGPLAPGDRVDASTLTVSARLAAVLPGIGVQPLGFQWARETGLEVPTREGWRVRFDVRSDLERQVQNLSAIRDHLASTRTSAQLIDVRFGDRPYYR